MTTQVSITPGPEQQKLEALQRDVDVAIEQSKTGQTMVFDEKLAEEIKVSGRERLKAKMVSAP